MNDEKRTLHINQIGANWEIESEAGTLGQAETRQQAEELARTLAKEVGAESIEVHTADGQVEAELHVEGGQGTS